MINTVTKQISSEDNNDFFYIVIYQDGTELFVPHDTDNRHYQEILEWVDAGNTITNSGGE